MVSVAMAGLGFNQTSDYSVGTVNSDSSNNHYHYQTLLRTVAMFLFSSLCFKFIVTGIAYLQKSYKISRPYFQWR
jgi:hypothetical protein